MDNVFKPKIQVLDDDPFTLKLLTRMLARLGHEDVEISTSAHAVLARLRADEYRPDLILLDLNMPEMDGLAFIRALAGQDYPGSLLLISGEDERILQSSARLTEAYRVKVLGHLGKPVDPLAMAALLNGWRPVTPSPQQAPPPSATSAYGVEALRAALRNRELINYYQPKVEVATGAAQGVEALVRWRHPRDGMVPPNLFIPLAEQHGLIDELTRQVLANALADTRRWQAAGQAFKVAINLSMDSLASVEFVDALCNQVAQAQVAPEALLFEITETRLQADQRNPLELLTRLRLKHFDLALDDFGTGYATFSQLSDFPFTELKVDRRFVHGAATDDKVRNFYRASLSLAREFGLHVVAEGVEDRADWDFVRASGGHCAQGYFIARPMAAMDLLEWLPRWQARVVQERLTEQE